MVEIFGVPYLKKGSGIHIKKKNRGKFTEYCGGEVTDECINRAKKSKNPKLRKRATFAANARRWKHKEGGELERGSKKKLIKGETGFVNKRPIPGLPNSATSKKKQKAEEGTKIHKPNGHRAITDNGWIPTKRLKKGTYGLIKKHAGGGGVTGEPAPAVPSLNEFISEKIDAVKRKALQASEQRMYPSVPIEGNRLSKEAWEKKLAEDEALYKQWLNDPRTQSHMRRTAEYNLKDLQAQREAGYDAYIGNGKILGPSCAFTTANNYGMDFMGSEQFRQNHENFGFKEIPYEKVQPSDVVLDFNNGQATHTMMFAGRDNSGIARFNHSNGGHTKEAIRKNAKYPFKGTPLAYEYVGTPQDSTNWINEYKQRYK